MENQLQSEITSFCLDFKSVILSTSKSDKPNASYTPYTVDKNGNYYIFISSMAKHADNLVHNKNVSLLFIEDEKDAGNIFARKRVSIEAEAEFLDRDSSHRDEAVRLMRDRFGEFFDAIASMPDFGCFRLTPKGGRYVKGFGKAYNFTMPEFEIEHMGAKSGMPHGVEFHEGVKKST